MDIRKKEEVEKVILGISPQVIVNTASISDINQCEEKKALAWEVNYSGTKHIVDTSKKIDAMLIYISTDLVFDGTKGNYSERETPRPLSQYGKSKLAAENYIKSYSSRYCIIRPSLIYGWSLNSSETFVEKILKSLQHGNSYKGFVDEYRNPIYVKNLCKIILTLAKRLKFNELFHICGPERLSRYDIALRTCNVFGLDPTGVIPSTSSEYPFAEIRPKDCSMDISKIKSVIIEKIADFNEGLYEMKFRKQGHGNGGTH